MESAVPLYLFVIVTTTLCLLAGFVLGAWRRASASTPPKKRPGSPPTTQDSENPSLARLEALAADQAELFSTLAKINTTVKRLSSRGAMQERRDRDRNDLADPPPIGTSKADLLRHYGMSGKVGPEFARAQQQLELEQRDRSH